MFVLVQGVQCAVLLLFMLMIRSSPARATLGVAEGLTRLRTHTGTHNLFFSSGRSPKNIILRPQDATVQPGPTPGCGMIVFPTRPTACWLERRWKCIDGWPLCTIYRLLHTPPQTERHASSTRVFLVAAFRPDIPYINPTSTFLPIIFHHRTGVLAY